MLGGLLLGYLFVNAYWGKNSLDINAVLWLSGVFYAAALSLLFGIYKYKPSHARKIFGILLDMTGITIGMLISGELGAMTYGAYK